MEKQVVDTMDILFLVLALALAMSTGVKTICQTNKELRNYEITYEDKTTSVKYTPSAKIYGEYDGTFTKAEIIAMTQIQDSNMPEPKKIYVSDSSNITINSLYHENLLLYANTIWNGMKDDDSKSSYYVNYDYKGQRYKVERK